MKIKTLLILIIVGLLTFLLGWFLHGTIRPLNQPKDVQVINGFIDSVSQVDTIRSNNFAYAVSGHFLLTESNCAGFNFIGRGFVLWTNEIACNDPDTLKFSWLSDSIFMTRSTSRINESCPPKVDIYKILFFDGKHLTLKDIWTGWNELKDESLDFIKEPN